MKYIALDYHKQFDHATVINIQMEEMVEKVGSCQEGILITHCDKAGSTKVYLRVVPKCHRKNIK